MQLKLSTFKYKFSIVPFIFSGFFGFFFIGMIPTFITEFEVFIIHYIIAGILLIVSITSLIIGVKNTINTLPTLKKLKEGKVVNLKIVDYLESTIKVDDTSYALYIIGYDENTDTHYRSNFCYKHNWQFEIGESLTMYILSDTFFYIDTKEYLKKRKQRI